MGWLVLVVAILSLAFPPLALVALALVVMGVFAKGMDVLSHSPDETAGGGGQAGRRRAAPRADGAMPRPGTQPQPGPVIDVRSYPIQTEQRLSGPAGQPPAGPR
ncbi:MAG: hypothetical protein ABSF26_14345 [Thermoguttaceae bacterium]|jgi:hypothetical protein